MAYESNLPQILRKMKQNQRKALEAIGIFVRGETQVCCPVRTGNLRDSYDYEVDEAMSRVRIGTNVEYGPYVELGTSKQREQPHLRSAIEENNGRIQKIAQEQMRRGLK